MLDVNNEQLSSKSSPDKSGDKSKEPLAKPENKENVSDDNQKEEAVSEKIKDDSDQKSKVPEKDLVPLEDSVESTSQIDTEKKDEEPSGNEAVDDAEKQGEAKTDDAGGQEMPKEKQKEAEVEESAATEAKKGLETPQFDISKLELEDILKLIQQLLRDFEIKDIRHQIDKLKLGFEKKFGVFLKEEKAAFVKAGGEVSEFYLTSPVKQKFDELLYEYKKKRQQYYQDIEREQKENLELRLMLIDELKQLIDNAEASTMYKDFRNLQDRWREIGQIPRAKYNDVWRTYHHHVERFYDLLHLNNDFRDLDFKHNLEEKSKLIEKAEALAKKDDVNHAFKELQILHKMWKEDIGPVARELREEVWQKFSEATKMIHKKRHEYQDRLDEKLKANVDLKLAVIEKIKAIDPTKNHNHKDWQESIKYLDALRDEFFAIGRVPKSKNEEIWQLFRESTRNFNTQKNRFYKDIKKGQRDNLKLKMDLVEQAESLKDSEDWHAATEVFKKIQADWKKIGHVPRRDSDRIWKRFKAACNHYFDRLHENQNVKDKGQSEIIEKKKDYLDHLKSALGKSKDLSMDFVQEVHEQWRELGALPHKVKHLDSKFNKLMDVVYKKLDIDQDEASFLRFKSNVDSLMDQNNTRKLDNEQLFIRRKIDDITKEIKQLENNISFISNASEDNPLVKNVYRNIEEHKSALEVWKRKIDYMRKMKY